MKPIHQSGKDLSSSKRKTLSAMEAEGPRNSNELRAKPANGPKQALAQMAPTAAK
jgi:hypothetical protein